MSLQRCRSQFEKGYALFAHSSNTLNCELDPQVCIGSFLCYDTHLMASCSQFKIVLDAGYAMLLVLQNLSLKTKFSNKLTLLAKSHEF